MAAPKLGFIGFGEAAKAMALGLGTEGLTDITATDALLGDPVRRHLVEARAEESGVELVEDLAAFMADRDILIAAVTSAVAVSVAEEAAQHLKPGQTYIDVNSVSPDTKIAIAEIIAPTGADFVEAAIMAAVPPLRHKVPILLCGPAAPALMERLAPYNMELEDFGPEYGRAAATKMFRSVVVKGLEALLQECVLAADQYGVAEKVLQSVEKGYPGVDWNTLAGYLIGRTAIHGERRAHEMDEVAATLKSIGIEPIMAEAAAARIRWLGGRGMKDHFGDEAPKDYQDVLERMRKAAEPE